jgi:hypothetical protein
MHLRGDPLHALALRSTLPASPTKAGDDVNVLYTVLIHYTPTPYTIHHTTPHHTTHTPYTTPHHTPYTIHHTPYTIHHTPYTHTIHHKAGDDANVAALKSKAGQLQMRLSSWVRDLFEKYDVRYTMQYIPYTMQHAPCTIHHAVYTIYHTACSIHRTPYTIHYTPYSIYYTLYTIHSYTHTLIHVRPIYA